MAVTERGYAETHPPRRGRWVIPVAAIVAAVGVVAAIVALRREPPAESSPAAVAALPVKKPIAPPPVATKPSAEPAAESPLLLERPNVRTDDLIAGRRFALAARNAAPDEANRLLREAGVTNVTIPPSAPKLDIALNLTSFWDGMERISRELRLPGMNINAGHYTFAANAVPSAVRFDLPHASSGGFYLQYWKEDSSYNPERKISPTAEMRLAFRLRKAPGVELVSFGRTLNLTVAEDDQGNSLLAPVKWQQFNADRNAASQSTEALIKKPGPGAKRIARLSGTLDVNVPADVIRARFENPLDEGKTFQSGDFSIKVARVGTNKVGRPNVVFEVRRKSLKPDVLEGGVWEMVSDMQPRLVNAEGKPVSMPSSGSTQRGFVRVELIAIGKDPFPPDTYLVADVPVDVRRGTLSFSFTDLEPPLPLEAP